MELARVVGFLQCTRCTYTRACRVMQGTLERRTTRLPSHHTHWNRAEPISR